MDLDATIVATSSPPGRSGRGLVRASGSGVRAAAEELGLAPRPGEVIAARMSLGSTSIPVLLGYFQGGSYTGEDLLEVQAPGNPALLGRIVDAMVDAAGGRRAEPGEFTARAFLRGRITLPQAEGVAATIAAEGDAALQGAELLRRGALGNAFAGIAEDLAQVLALVEAGIDFAEEEDVVAIDDGTLRSRLDTAHASLHAILDRSMPMRALGGIPRIVLAGAPNAGKSTLFNALLERDRVVASALPGTTRDAIGEPLAIEGTQVLLVDAAGEASATTELERSMQDAATDAILHADLVLHCVAPGVDDPPCTPRSLLVHTKADLRDVTPETGICAVSGDGLDALRTRIASQVRALRHPSVDALALQPRHEAHLEEARDAVDDAVGVIAARELVATSLRRALDALGALGGSVTSDDIIGRVFSTFCVGK